MIPAESARHVSTPSEGRPRQVLRTLKSLYLVCMLLGVVLAALAAARLASAVPPLITDIFLVEQDLPSFVLLAIFILLLGSWPQALSRLAPALAWATKRRRRVAYAFAGLAAVLGFAGAYLVCLNYPLSTDEFMASFDATIFRHGRLLAPTAPEWRGFVPALQPIFRLHTPGGAALASAYLPVNAAFRALFSLVGLENLASSAWAGIAVLATYDVARRLWPDRPEAAVTAAALLATSAQFVITAMTPYAMSAHLALNMLWLSLFLRRSWWAQIIAAAVAFLACGLHQVIFHPLFAAPFVLQLWFERRWARAAFYTAAYGAICLFWSMYFTLALRSAGLQAPDSSGAANLFLTAMQLLAGFDPTAAFTVTVENLLRFMAWQNPLTIPLALIVLPYALRARGPIQSLWSGALLTLGVVFILMPFQGHGWGFRYLHGFLGSFSLLAALGLMKTADADPPQRSRLAGAVAVACVFSLVCLLPLRAWQANAFIRPYARAESAIRRSDADAVLVDPTGLLYAIDLTRNDPFLRNRPKVLALSRMSAADVASICARGRVVVFDRTAAAASGIRRIKEQEPSELAGLRSLLHEPGCRQHSDGKQG